MSGYIDDSLREERFRDASRDYDSIISGRFNSAPASEAEEVMVIIPEFEEHLEWGPCKWMPRGATLPEVGDIALICFDQNQQPWVVAWWPA